MGLRDRDYMQDDSGEERGRRYDDEVQEAEYGGFRARRQGQNRKLVIILLVAIAVLVTLGILSTSK